MKKIVTFLILCLISSLCFSQIILNSNTTPSTCQNNGTITINASGGGGSYYSYILIGGPSGVSLPLATGNVFYGLPSGTYTIQVADNNGNVNNISATVSGNYLNPVISSVSVIHCSITANMQAGTGKIPFEYACVAAGSIAPNNSAYQNNNVFNALPNGYYDIYVKDACNNINVYQNVGVSVNFSFDYGCDNSPAGNDINAVISNYTQGADGPPPYTYSWSSGLTGTLSTSPAYTTFTFSPNCTNSTITVTNGCGQSQTKTVNCLLQNVLCANFANGTAATIADGGTPPYSYSYSSSANNTTGNYTGLPSSPPYYQFYVTDACGRLNLNYGTCYPNSGIYNLNPNWVNFSLDCAALYVSYSAYEGWCQNSSRHFPITYTCTSCSPTISITTNGTATFPLSAAGQTITLTDACGNQVTRIAPVPPTPVISLSKTITCSSISASASIYCNPSPAINYILYCKRDKF